MKREEDQKLWDLLGRAAEPKISPFFARDVAREIRNSRSSLHLRGWFDLRKLIPAAGIATALIAVTFLRLQTAVGPFDDANSDKFAMVEAQDYDVIADLDDLATLDETSWDEVAIL